MSKNKNMPLAKSYGKEEEVAVTEIIGTNQLFSDQQVREFEINTRSL